MVLKVLFCYTDKDKQMVKKCRGHLGMLEHNGLIEIWDQGNIQAGIEWEEEMKTHLNQAEMILLFISDSFLASDYHYKVATKRAIERHEHKEARVIPVILRFCDWRSIQPLDKLLPLPDDGKPVADWKPQDKGYTKVAIGIRKVIEQWNTYTLPGPNAEREAFMTDLDRLVEAVNRQLLPPARAMATASTLQQLSILTPDGVTLADLAAGWRVLARSRQPAEAIEIERRRATCGELAGLAAQLTSEPGDLARARKAWQSWSTAFEKSDDPRQATMAKTFAREHGELQAEAEAR